MNATKRFAVAVIAVVAFSQTAIGQGTDRSVQSPARPFGLEIVDTVKIGGSEAASSEFIKGTMPGLAGFLNSGGAAPDSKNWIALDPSKISLETMAAVRAYFVGESTDNENTLGFNPVGIGPNTKGAQLIFPNASTKAAFATIPSNPSLNKEFPLVPGDFVNLGTYAAGTNFDFFLISDGAKKGTVVTSTTTDLGKHVVAYAKKDSPYLILAFDDVVKGKSDGDFNDNVLALDIGVKNVAALTGAPEPMTFAVFGSFMAVAVWAKRRKKQQN